MVCMVKIDYTCVSFNIFKVFGKMKNQVKFRQTRFQGIKVRNFWGRFQCFNFSDPILGLKLEHNDIESFLTLPDLT